jgi:hypothetical protein
MHEKMYLIIEKNRFRDRFGGTVTTAILEVLNKERDEKLLDSICAVLHKFNDVIRLVDEATGLTQNDEEWETYEEESHERYINILLKQLNNLYLRFGKMGFLQDFTNIYWKHNQNFILQLWKELPEGKSVTSNETSFIKLFEDFFSETIKEFPNFIVKQLKEFQNIYRASRYKVHENYKYIMPDPKYCHDNRWNDDGVAFLYLSYDNEGIVYQNIKQAQKTCFEELRAEEGEELSVCRFKVVHKRIKILDLSFDGIDYEKELGKLNEIEKVYKDRVWKEIQSKPKLQKRMINYVRTKNEGAFAEELKIIQEKMGLELEMHRDIQWQLSKILIGNICDAIFYAVDKENDPELEAYIPFRAFSRYLIAHGFGGVAYRSTRMDMIGLHGKCLTLFDKNDATYVEGEMEVYEYHKDRCEFIEKY